MTTDPQRIAVFGAAGWVGRAVLEDLEGRHTTRASDHGPGAWKAYEDVDGTWSGDIAHCDIANYEQVEAAIDGMDAIIHTAVLGGGVQGAYTAGSDLPWLVNLKGLWNVLDVARERQIRRVVHVGSCQVEHPQGVFFDADVRRPDGAAYAVSKRLQEEMCRQFHEAFGMSIVVLRPCSIVDSRLGISKYRKALGPQDVGSVCRHDLAEACRLAVEVDGIGLEILHTAGLPEADAHCNTAHGREILGLEYQGDLRRFSVADNAE
ncbi:MAG: NAD(P)-dependent oxidoreductase [Gemmatimonadetes bacterium]|jgi:nucleoside-diphosphate-sugar epimerase|nr:NAD(P)-dependent oxidoreductase [Gemmatimonadota bacterium]MBT6145754.1 NAD(P)-dependent oxidoreductase [Gemmatimonadota bacterium]MBT7859315.1 NAD(P)-dependent oxidoreductase [Gemmatimonadota bacterium]